MQMQSIACANYFKATFINADVHADPQSMVRCNCIAGSRTSAVPGCDGLLCLHSVVVVTCCRIL
jgi:hypothetical protein